MLDPDAIERLFSLDTESGGDLVPKLCALFLKNFPECNEKMKNALALGDANTVESNAHHLKSSCWYFGAGALAGLLESVEQKSRRGDLDALASLLPQVEKEFSGIMGEIELLPGRKASLDAGREA